MPGTVGTAAQFEAPESGAVRALMRIQRRWRRHARSGILLPHAHARFRRAIERRALWMAEDAARELPNLPLEDALQLVHLYFERGSLKAGPAARRWLVRYISEGSPSMRDVAKVTASLASCTAKRLA
jgi:hypothetical protein